MASASEDEIDTANVDADVNVTEGGDLDEDDLAERAEAGDSFPVPGLDLKELMPVEQTVVILKPDAESYEKEIKKMIEDADFAVVKMTRTRLRRERSEL